MLYELIYTSKSRGEMSLCQLDNILTAAREKNDDHAVTGVLVYHNGEFAQLLEGDQDEVMRIYSRIARDPRHHDVKIVWEASVRHRSFEDWKMGFVDIRHMDLAQHRRGVYHIRDMDGLSNLFAKDHGNTGLYFLKSVVRHHMNSA